VSAAPAEHLTTSELRRLIGQLVLSARSHPAFVWAWSRWRRRHQAAAARYHRQRRIRMQL
jgi:hypothetical protein